MKSIFGYLVAVLLVVFFSAPAFAEDDPITVIMPVYNRDQLVVDSILSLRAQTHTNWRLIVIDDQSEDGTREVVKIMAENDPRIELVVMEENGGPARARNRGLEMAGTQYIAFLDSDDVWDTRKLELQVAQMRQTGSAITYTGYQLIDGRGDRVSSAIRPSPRVGSRSLLRNNEIVLSSVMLDLSQLGETQFPLVNRAADFALWRVILSEVEAAELVDHNLTFLRKWSDNFSGSKLRQGIERWRYLRDFEKMSVMQSLFFTAEYGLYTGAKYFLQFSRKQPNRCTMRLLE